MTITNKMTQTATVSLFLLTISACGGGGGDGGTSAAPKADTGVGTTTSTTTTTTTTTVSYAPDPAKQKETASKSSELYVEEAFQFNTYKTLTLDIQAYDEEGEPLANTLMFLSSIPDEMIEKESELLRQKSLVAVLKLNENGAYYGEIEIAADVNNTLVQLNAMGIENEAIIAVPENNILQYQF